jgi:hypothetical protein
MMSAILVTWISAALPLPGDPPIASLPNVFDPGRPRPDPWKPEPTILCLSFSPGMI